ncbi:MAG: tetratricopeptide repeat protein [Candidatus Cloacimonadales bacterium]|nr:tetratricopeptide repeat protein [Candidatus Cloacimonadales bacterium]
MLRFSLLALAVLLVISGCVYYNTFFNAEKYFDEAQVMALREDGQPSANAVQDYNKTIKKCGIVLTDYKDSKYADDALFLMARCFYYIGRNSTQAIKHLEELIEFYPESEFIPDAKLYIARANYQFGKKKLAFELLQEFLKDNKYKDDHSKALQLLADYHLADKNFVDADYYLNRIIEKYPKSKEYDSAFFSQGKTQFEAGNYEKSNEVFFSLLKSKVPRNLKFDARYYIALNYIMLGDFDKAEKYSLNLLKDEYREDKISKIQLLKARSLAGNGDYDNAIQLFNAVSTDNPRSLLSAESSFYLAELYFNDLHDYEHAIESYNKVKKESAQTEFLEQSVTRSAVASQIIQFNNPDSHLTVEELVLQQFKLAEFYVEYLNLPDSALIVYDHITEQKGAFIQKLDSLRISLRAYSDSLEAMAQLETTLQAEQTEKANEEIVADSTKIADEKLIEEELTFENIEPDTTEIAELVRPDSSETEEKISFDSLLVLEEIIPDSIALVETSLDSTFTAKQAEPGKTAEPLTLAKVTTEKLRLQAEVTVLNQQVSRNEQDIIKYNDEFIPFAKFIKLWLYKIVYNDSLRIQEQFADLAENYPENKYTYAAELMLQDKKVEITTRQQVMALAQYEKAIENIYTAPDSANVLLQEIAADSSNIYFLKANYSLGYLNHFLLADSVAAKQHYDIVMSVKENNEYLPAVQKLYNGNTFNVVTRLPAIIQLERKLAAQEEAALKKAEEEATETTKEDSEQTSKQKDIKKENLTKEELEKQKTSKNEMKEIIEKTEEIEPEIDESNKSIEPEESIEDSEKIIIDEMENLPVVEKEEIPVKEEVPVIEKEELPADENEALPVKEEVPVIEKEELPAGENEALPVDEKVKETPSKETETIKDETQPKETKIVEEETNSDSTKTTKQQTEEKSTEDPQQPDNSTEN